MAGQDRQGRGDQTQLLQQNNWAGGINSASQAEEIRDDEAQDIENFLYDSDDNLIVRTGVEDWLGENLSTRLTSVHRYVDNSGTVRIIYTTSNIIKRADENGANITAITGGLTLPTDLFWQWRTFTGFAIGVNQGTGSNVNPVKVNGSNNAVALGGSPPKAKYIEVWNSRVWLVSAVDHNRIIGSAVGNAEDWTTTGAAGRIILDIDPGDGDPITGLVEFRNSLFVFKRKKIHIVSAIGPPATDPENIRVDIFTKNIGCFSPWSIQPVLNDVLYLSDSGIASLVQSEFGELKSALLSSKVAELAELKKNTNEISSFVLDDINQYWLSVPKSVSPRNVAETYVFHYDKIDQQIRRWTRFTGKVTGTAFAEKLNTDYKEYLIAFKDDVGTTNTIYKYSPINPEQIFNDDGDGYSKTLVTKAYSAEALLFRKEWVRNGFGIRLLTELLSLGVEYFFDNKPTRGGNYSHVFTFTDEGVLIWDVGDWDDFNWATEAARDEYVWRKFKKNQFGRKAVTVTFKFTNTTEDQAYIMKYFALEYKMLGQRHVTTV